jgi:signal transduction histidine kinase
VSESSARPPSDGETASTEPAATESGTRATASAEHLGELLASISHDLRTPLGIVMGAFREVRNALPPESQAYARLVDRSTERLVQLADRLARAGALVGGRAGDGKHAARSSLVVRDAALRVQTRNDAPIRVDLGEDLEVALDGPRATDALANLMHLADPAADPAVRVSQTDGRIEVRIRLRSEPATGHEVERSFGRTGERARVNLDLYFARIELESQGCTLSFDGRELIVRVPLA